MRRAESRLAIVLAIALFPIALINPRTAAQAGGRVAFGINPTIVRTGQPASPELSRSSVRIDLLILSTGTSFTFFVDMSVGTVVSLTTPISVISVSLLAVDFSVSFGASHSQIVLTYNGQPKPFAYGDCLTMKIDFI